MTLPVARVLKEERAADSRMRTSRCTIVSPRSSQPTSYHNLSSDRARVRIGSVQSAFNAEKNSPLPSEPLESMKDNSYY